MKWFEREFAGRGVIGWRAANMTWTCGSSCCKFVPSFSARKKMNSDLMEWLLFSAFFRKQTRFISVSSIESPDVAFTYTKHLWAARQSDEVQIQLEKLIDLLESQNMVSGWATPLKMLFETWRMEARINASLDRGGGNIFNFWIFGRTAVHFFLIPRGFWARFLFYLLKGGPLRKI